MNCLFVFQIHWFDPALGELKVPLYFTENRVRNVFKHSKVKSLTANSAKDLKVLKIHLRGDCCWKVYQKSFRKGRKILLGKGYKGRTPASWAGSLGSFEKDRCVGGSLEKANY